jgi:hypothetical protein
MWVSDWELQIDLGAGASIEPADQLAFKAGSPGLRTKNGVSDANTLSFAVSAPLQVIVPEISLSGDSVSDASTYAETLSHSRHVWISCHNRQHNILARRAHALFS